MTKRKPLGWYEAGNFGEVPDCGPCGEVWFSPGFAEACASVAIEHATTSYDLGRNVLNEYHARRHPADMGLAVQRSTE